MADGFRHSRRRASARRDVVGDAVNLLNNGDDEHCLLEHDAEQAWAGRNRYYGTLVRQRNRSDRRTGHQLQSCQVWRFHLVQRSLRHLRRHEPARHHLGLKLWQQPEWARRNFLRHKQPAAFRQLGQPDCGRHSANAAGGKVALYFPNPIIFIPRKLCAGGISLATAPLPRR